VEEGSLKGLGCSRIERLREQEVKIIQEMGEGRFFKDWDHALSLYIPAKHVSIE